MIEKPDRTMALNLLREYTKSTALISHALFVEGVMRFIARQHGEDEDMWGVVGLIHDLDYEQFPEAHCHKSQEILAGQGWPETYIRAVMSHGWGICTDVEPLSHMERTLYAIDELTGLVHTTALVRPSKSVQDTEVRSVKKKWKDKRFAAGVDRSVIERGAGLLEMELDDLIALTIKGMREVDLFSSADS